MSESRDRGSHGGPQIPVIRQLRRIGRRLWTRSSLQFLPPLLMFSVYIATYVLFLFIRFDSFQPDYYDLGLWSRALFSASTDPSMIPGLILPTKNSMIGHTDPLLLLLVPFSRLSPDPRWLLVLTTVALGASIFPLYLLARRCLSSVALAWAFCGVYLLNPLFNDINRYDFQPIAFAPVLIFLALLFYQRGNAVGFVSSIIIADLVQEFIALLTAFMAVSLLLVQLIESRRKGPKDQSPGLRPLILGLATLVCVGWFSFAYMIQSYFDPSTPLISYLSVASAGPDPHGKSLYLFLMVAPVLFLPLLEPILLAPVLPYVGVVLLGSHLAYWTIYYQYGAFTVPFIFYSTLVSARRVSRWLPNRFQLPSLRIIIGLLVISNIAFFASYSALSSSSPTAYTWSHVDSHDRVLSYLISLIPDGASVLTQGQIYTHIINRAEISLYMGSVELPNRVSAVAPQYLIFDTTLDSFYYPPTIYGVPPSSSVPPSRLLPQMVSANGYGLYSAYDGAYLFEKGYRGPFHSPPGTSSEPLIFDGTWYTNVTSTPIPFGMNMTGGQNVGIARENTLFVNQTSFSLSFQLSESGKYLSNSWASVILGWKDTLNYNMINLDYLGGQMSLTTVTNGMPRTVQIGSPSPFSSVQQYFHLVASGGSLQVLLNAQLIGVAPANPSSLAGWIGFENWNENTTIQFLQFTSLQ